MANPLERSIKSALKANEEIGKFFAQVGSVNNPRGYITTAYRQARRAMLTALKEDNPTLAAADVMAELRKSIVSGTNSMFVEAEAMGSEEADRQLSYYSVKPLKRPLDNLRTRPSLQSVTAKVDAQTASIIALISTGAADAQIIGDADRSGALRYSDISLTVSSLVPSLWWQSYAYSVQAATANQPVQFSKQAIAALDDRTTDCCLKVHAQIQPLDGKFELTGTPRYADEMDWAPFHWYCRTSVALYLPEFDMGLTADMRAGAQQITKERGQGGTGARYPVDAYG